MRFRIRVTLLVVGLVTCFSISLAIGQKLAKQAFKSSKAPKTTANTILTMRPSALVDPMIGTDVGNTFVGAALPFSLAKPGPDVLPPYNTTGYSANGQIEGFSHTHLSGTGGGGRYGNIMLTPLVGGPTLKARAGIRTSEVAKAGYYAVTLGRKPGDVRTELTLTERAGWHRYRFFTWDKRPTIEATVMIDPTHVISRRRDSLDSRCLKSHIQVDDDGAIVGQGSFAGGWGGQNPYTVYFYILPNIKPIATGAWQEDSVFTEVSTQAKGRSCGIYLKYNFRQQQELLIKVGISMRSVADAKANLEAQPGWDFDQTRALAASAWDEQLGKIKVAGGVPEQQVQFYTNLYHTFLMPHNHTGQSPEYETTEPTFWDHYCLWDVHRSVMPLHTLIAPKLQRDIIKSLLRVGKYTGWLPDAWVAGGHGQQQGGTNADIVMTDAIMKGLIPTTDKATCDSIWKYCYRNATQQTDRPGVYGRHTALLDKYGYLPADVKCGSSITAEVAYNDFCLSLLATKLGKTKEAATLLTNSQRVWNLWKADTGYLWAKDRNGNWAPNFNRVNTRPDSWNGPHFYEASCWAYSFYMPHDIPGLISRRGGNEKFIQWLDRFVNGGDFELENEPVFLVPYLYNYAGRPDKTAVRVHNLLQHEFTASRKGLPGQDDSGAISSWYVWSSMGLMPVAGQDLYLIGSPLWQTTTIELEGKKTIEIQASNYGPSNIYIQSASLNGQPISKPFITHTQLCKGGKLVFVMGAQLSKWGQKID